MADPEIHPCNAFAGRGVYVLDGHEITRRGLRQLVESDGLGIAGESGSAREAVRRIPALRPELVITDNDLPDGSGADACRAVAAADPRIRCVMMTEVGDEAVLIDAILAGACGEQLRLIRRALAGHTAYSGRFYPAITAPFALLEPHHPDDRLLTLTRQEMTAAIGLGKGLSNRQISQEMFLAEKTVKNMVSTILTKLGAATRTQAALLVTTALHHSEDPVYRGYRSSQFPDLIPEVTAALLNCVSEARAVPPTDQERAADAPRLAAALAAARTGPG